jgi:hypothetical protein
VDKSHGPRITTYQSNIGGVTATNGNFGYVGMPQTTHRNYNSGSSATEDEFKARAKQFKRSQIKARLLKKLAIFGIFVAVVVVILAIIGLVLNNRYAGRALPYSYIGDISIGGLTEAEIKAVLDKKANKTVITLTEGGLTRYVKPIEFSAKFNTEQASKDAMVGFNPFNYLTKREFNVPVSIEEKQVDGYIRLHVADKQTNAENADIIKQGKEIVIKPEVQGFRTSTTYVTKEIEKQLSLMKNPVVSLSAEYDRPDITSEDLKDDLKRASDLVNTDIALKVFNTKIAPKTEDKINWLSIKKVQNTNDVVIEFDQTKVREYVFGIAQKYNKQKVDETLAINEQGQQYIKAGSKGQQVKDIDKIASEFYSALTSAKGALIALEFEYTDYAIVDRQLLTVNNDTSQAIDDNQQSSQSNNGPVASGNNASNNSNGSNNNQGANNNPSNL